MISEDLPLLATLKTGRPVMWEFTREEQFIGATTRHPMTTHVKLGAKKDGTLTAIQFRVVSNTGRVRQSRRRNARQRMSGPWAMYRCPNKKADGYAVYTNLVRRRVPRVRSGADDVCDRIGDGRAGRAARDRPDRAAPQERHRAKRPHGIGLEGVGGSHDRQLRARSMHRCGRNGAGQRPRLAETRRRASGWKAAASRSRCSIACRRPSNARDPRSRCCPTGPTISRSARSRSATVWLPPSSRSSHKS